MAHNVIYQGKPYHDISDDADSAVNVGKLDPLFGEGEPVMIDLDDASVNTDPTDTEWADALDALADTIEQEGCAALCGHRTGGECTCGRADKAAQLREQAEVVRPPSEKERQLAALDLYAAAVLREENARRLLQRVLPMLTKLGDYIGNGPIDTSREKSLGERCDLIGDIKDWLEVD